LGPGACSTPRANNRQLDHLRGFIAGISIYAVLSWLAADDVTKLVMWLFGVFGVGWWYTVSGGSWFSKHTGFARWLVVSAGLLALGLVIGAAAGLLFPNPEAHASRQLQAMRAVQVVYLLGAVPAMEEILFRGLLYEVFAGRGALIAVLATTFADAVAHGVAHHSATYAVAVIPVGLVLGSLRMLSRGISVPVLLHILGNALAA
jgi:membrane protease YdiL (CAAX protease family)